MFAIGISINEKNISLVLINRNGDVIKKEKLKKTPSQNAHDLIDELAQAILALKATHAIQGVGIGYTGYVDPKTGIVHDARYLKQEGINLHDELCQRVENTPIYLSGGTNIAALAEKYYGVAQGHHDFLYLAVGTSLRGAAISNNHLVIGSNAYAMEIGHIALDPVNGRECPCGMRGCPEMYASEGGMQIGVRERAKHYADSPLTEKAKVSEILAQARKGDELALVIMKEATDWLAKVAAYAAGMFNPDLIVISGSLGHKAPDFFVEGMAHKLKKLILPATKENLSVVKPKVEEIAIGAACLVWEFGEQDSQPVTS